MHRWVLLNLIALCLFGGACSLRQATYRYADWLIEHRLKHYFDLNHEQKKVLSELVDHALNDVNTAVIPKISSYLVSLAAKEADGLFTLDDAAWLMTRYNESIALLIDASADEMASLLASLTKEQVEFFQNELKKDGEESAQRLLGSDTDFRDKELANFHKKFGRVIGDLSDEQEFKLSAILDMSKAQGEERYRIRQEMNETFVNFLKTRPSEDLIAKQIRDWAKDRSVMISTPALRQRYLQRSAAMAYKMTEIDKILRPEQRTAIGKELMGLSSDVLDMGKVQF